MVWGFFVDSRHSAEEFNLRIRQVTGSTIMVPPLFDLSKYARVCSDVGGSCGLLLEGRAGDCCIDFNGM